MISGTLALLALRARAMAAVSATTGSTTLAGTSTGYSRSSGSFLSDGFAPGMELTLVTGFSVAGNNQAVTTQGRIVTAVTALTLSCTGCATDASASGRVITAGVPYCRAYDNVATTPTSGFPYLEELFVPNANTVRTYPVASAYAEDRGLYLLTWYGLAGKGPDAIRRGVDAILARFTGGTALTLSDSTILRIPTELGPKAGQITPVAGGWAYSVIEIPYVGESINAIA